MAICEYRYDGSPDSRTLSVKRGSFSDNLVMQDDPFMVVLYVAVWYTAAWYCCMVHGSLVLLYGTRQFGTAVWYTAAWYCCMIHGSFVLLYGTRQLGTAV